MSGASQKEQLLASIRRALSDGVISTRELLDCLPRDEVSGYPTWVGEVAAESESPADPVAEVATESISDCEAHGRRLAQAATLNGWAEAEARRRERLGLPVRVHVQAEEPQPPRQEPGFNGPG